MNQTQTTVTFSKLRSGGWGVRGPAAAIVVGQTAQVAKRDGTVSTVTVSKVLWTDGTMSIASILSDRAPRAQRGGVGRQCRTDGNCSSFGDGRSCGAPDCDGY